MALATSANKGAYPDVSFFPPADLVPDALVLQVTTLGPPVEGDAVAVRVPFIAADPTVGFVDELEDIDETDPTLDERVLLTGKVAVLTKVSREAYQAEGVAGLLTDSLKRAVITKADRAFITNASDPTGIAQTPGIFDAGQLGANLDPFISAAAYIENSGGTVTHVLASPLAWAKLQTLKAGTGSNVPLLGTPADAADRRLLGIPVLVSPDVAANTIVLVDRSAVIASVGEVQTAVSEHRYFESDAFGLRVTWRLGWTVVRPNRLAKVTLPA